MKILSLFDGISCARVACDKAGIPVELYYASEIDKYAIQIAQKNYPGTIQVGSVVGLDCSQFKGIDLLVGGSPCQDLSIAKKNREGLAGSRSGLFWEYVRIRDEVKPKYFILENVASMPKEAKQVITEALGVEPVMIDAALVSAQRRKRLFWVGKLVRGKYEQVHIPQPEDRGILLKDIIEKEVDEKYFTKMDFTKRFDYKHHKEPFEEKATALRATDYKGTHNVVYQYRRTYWRETKGGKVPTLTANMGTGGNNVPYTVAVIPEAERPKGNYLPRERVLGVNGKFRAVSTISNQQPWIDGNPIRKLTPLECERLQCVPDGYTDGVSNTQRYKALGNAFNADVVAHILKHL